MITPGGLPAPIHRPSNKRDSPGSCWIDLAQADRSRGPTRPVYWVDIRTSRQANTLALPGALRVAPSEIALKSFLRRGTVILIGTGLDEVAVEAACVALLEAGLPSVRALRGGARAWRAAGRPVVLSPNSVNSNEMDAFDFIETAARERWPVIAVDFPADASVPVPAARLARVTSRQPWLPAQWFPAAVRRNEPLIVLAADRARDDRPGAKPNAPSSSAGAGNLVWIRGGFAAYRDAVERQRALASSRGQALHPSCGGG